MDLRLLFLAASLLLAGCAQPAGPIIEDVDLADFGVNGDPFLGDPDAAIQVVAYEAPACSSCRYYHANVFPEVQADFIDTGLIGYHFVQYTINYAYDEAANVAIECAYREGGVEAYLHMIELTFAKQGKTTEIPAMLGETASIFGLNNDVLQTCYADQETLGEVNSDIAAGSTSGAGNNPGFAIIKGDKVIIDPGADGPRAAIEALL